MKEIKLTQGHVAWIDDEDFEKVSKYAWRVLIDKHTVYARRNACLKRKRTTQLLHRFVLGVTDSKVEVDHEDHNGLNCQKYNLRKATHTQNGGNRTPKKGRSKYKGVQPSLNKWQSFLKVRGKTKYLGTSITEEEAAKVYDIAARQHFGKFAFLNFKTGDSE